MNQSLSAHISFVVPVFNGGEAFELCLQSLCALEPAPLEIVVVDDGSTDQSADLARRAGARVLATSRPRSGPAIARNLGAQAAKGEFLFFLDADCSIHADALRVAAGVLDEHPEVAALIGSYDDRPTSPNLLSQYKNLAHHAVHQSAPVNGFTFWGACGVIRRDVFLQLNGFDERYGRPCVEDIELGYRLVESGHRIRVCRDLLITHHKTWRPLGLLKTEVFDRAIPWSELILSRRRMENALNINRAARLRVALAGLIPLFALAGFWWQPAWWLLAAVAGVLLVLDWPILSYLAKLRGVWFAIQVIPWHWFSHFYSGVAFALVILKRVRISSGDSLAPPVTLPEPPR